MNRYEQLRHDVLSRVADFGQENRETFERSRVALDAFAAVAAAAAEMKRADLEGISQQFVLVRPKAELRRDLTESLDRFERQRGESVTWLRSLEKQPSVDWSQSHTSTFGTMAAGDMLASWLAHDMLHLRQIAKRLYELAEVRAGGYSSAYAGPWGA